MTALDSLLNSWHTSRDEAYIPLLHKAFSSLSNDKKADLILDAQQTDTYASRIILSLLENPETWDFFISSLCYKKDTGRSRENKQPSTTFFCLEDLENLDPDDIVFLKPLNLKQDSKLGSTPVIEGVLLGGAGTRWTKECNLHQDTFNTLKQTISQTLSLPLEQAHKIALGFKSSVPFGPDGISILGLKLYSAFNQGISSFLFMTSLHTDKTAMEYVRTLIPSDSCTITRILQPVFPRRVPSLDSLTELIQTEKESFSEKDLNSLKKLCAGKAGEILLTRNSDNASLYSPVFAPQNHWDYIKYLFLNKTFLQLFKHNTAPDGSLQDIFLHVSNQDNAGAHWAVRTTSDNTQYSPAITACTLLKTSLNKPLKDQGLPSFYTYLDQIDALDYSAWQEHRQQTITRLKHYHCAVVECAATPGRPAGGGLAWVKGEGERSICVVEKAHIEGGKGASLTYTNTNTITFSLLALCLAVGIRRKDLALLISPDQAGKFSDKKLDALLDQGIARIEKIIPLRYKPRIIRTSEENLYAGASIERDIHGPLGRVFQAHVLVVESMDTFYHAACEWDRDLINRVIDFSKHQQLERDFGARMGFIPIKSLSEFTFIQRPLYAHMRSIFPDKPHDYTILSPPDALAESLRKNHKFSAFELLKALILNGYQLLGKETVAVLHDAPDISETDFFKACKEIPEVELEEVKELLKVLAEFSLRKKPAE